MIHLSSFRPKFVDSFIIDTNESLFLNKLLSMFLCKSFPISARVSNLRLRNTVQRCYMEMRLDNLDIVFRLVSASIGLLKHMLEDLVSNFVLRLV